MEKRSGKRAPSGQDIAIEDDERHSDAIDAYIARNRDALKKSIARGRSQLARGEVSKKSISDIIKEGRARHAKKR